MKCETSVMIDNRKRFRGKIVEADADGFTLERDQAAYGEEPAGRAFPSRRSAEARLILTDDLIRDALTRRQGREGRTAANQNEAEDEE